MQSKIDIENVYELLPAQLGFLIESEAGKNNFYKQQITVKVTKELARDPSSLAESIKNIHNKSEMLRTIFDFSAAQPLQIVLVGIPPIITAVTCNNSKMQALLNNELDKLDGISELPPIRYLILKTSDDTYLTITYNHIILDGPSVYLLLKAIITNDARIIKNCTAVYLDWYQNNILDSNEKLWEGKLAELPVEDVDIFPNQTNRSSFQTVVVNIDKFQVSKLSQIARGCGVTLAVLMQTLWQYWAQAFFAQPNLMYGLVTTTRIPDVNEDCLGVFINTIPWCAKSNYLSLETSFIETQNKLLDLQEIKHVPLNRIARLMHSKVLFFDILLTVTTKTNSGISKNLYEITNTHENIGYPFSVDIDILQNLIKVTYSSVLNENCFNCNQALESFTKYLSNQIRTNNFINVKSTFHPMLNSKTDNNTIPINALVQHVAQVLNVTPNSIDINKSFILNGGDSILSLKLKNLLNEDAYDIGVGQIIKTDKLSNLSQFIVKKNNLVSSKLKKTLLAPTRIIDILQGYKLGFADNFHEQAAFKIKGNFDCKSFQLALNKIGENVSALRIKYDNTAPYEIHVAESARVSYHHNIATEIKFEAFIENISKVDIGKNFNPGNGPLLRAYTQTNFDGSFWYLFISFSTLVTDGWSFSNLLELIIATYAKIKRNLEVDFHDDNYLEAIASMYKTSSLDYDAAPANLVNNKIQGHRFSFSVEETLLINNTIKQSRMTPSTFFEEVIKKVLTKSAVSTLYTYENGRDISNVNVINTIGSFCYLRQSNIVISKNKKKSSSAYYVYENYPKESEERLRRDKHDDFHEMGNWRRPLLPPTINIGILIANMDDKYEIDVLIRGNNKSKKIAKTLYLNLRKKLINDQ